MRRVKEKCPFLLDHYTGPGPGFGPCGGIGELGVVSANTIWH